MVVHLKIDQVSITSRQLEFYTNGNLISFGTGFFIKWEESVHLVSNLHNFSGRDIFTGKHLSEKTLAEPDEVKYQIFRGGDINKRQLASTRLKGEFGDPTYKAHPSSQIIDAASVKVSHDEVEAIPINSIPQEKIHLSVSEEIFVIGFPAGVNTHGLPIWKRGTVASEPQLPSTTYLRS